VELDAVPAGEGLVRDGRAVTPHTGSHHDAEAVSKGGARDALRGLSALAISVTRDSALLVPPIAGEVIAAQRLSTRSRP
ncbi:hypothetical protein AB0H34_09100, partial [Saccharopolyspora shandongensis]|uniref:hypothetical protein n=1 Tax=Saccharopolyspora shandongensis TaxID=418495 RepID=UPI0033C81AD3